MTIDTELDTWRQEWQSETEPLPDLKQKIKRQNIRMTGGVVVIGVCLAISAALARRSSFMSGLAVGIWFSSLCMGGYNLWIRRGAWKPTAQTTLAYAELNCKRAIARAKTLRFGFYFLLAAILPYGTYVTWRWKGLSAMETAILTGMMIELLFFQYLRQRQKREVETSGNLLKRVRESNSE